MNNAGLPGTGLGGLFYVLLALWMPVAELYATLRGRSSRDRWRVVGTQFAMACAVVASVGGSLALYLRLTDVPVTLGLTGHQLLAAPVLVAGGLLLVLTSVLRIWAALDRGVATPPAPPAPPLRADDLDAGPDRDRVPTGAGR